MRYYALFLFTLSLFLFSDGSLLRAQTSPTITIPLTVQDVTGYTRTNDPMSSSVPIPLSAINDSWSLVSSTNTNIPLQTKVLSGQRTPWLLLDFPSSTGASGSSTYTLRNTAPSVAASGITYLHSSSTETITTGPIKVTIGTAPFLGVTGLWFDANSNGAYEVSEQRIGAGSASALQIVNAETTTTINAGATPTSVTWEDEGTQRGTLKIDGTFTESSATLLTYSLRMTFWSGRSDIGIDMVLKNSKNGTARLVKLSSASFQIGTSATTLRANRVGDRTWAMADTTGKTIQWLPSTEQISTAYDPNSTPRVERVTALNNVDTNGGYVINDLSYLSANATVDFRPNLTSGEQTAAANRAKTTLFARADASWYANQSSFGLPGFGTLADEQAAYSAWYWTWPNPNNNYAAVPHLSRPTNFYPSWSTINALEDPEGDFVQENNLMYIRLGDQAYKDRMDAFARYAMNQWIFRTDAFTDYDNDYWDGPHTTTRGTDTISNATAADQQHIANDFAHGRVDYSHAWGSGLVDYYYLTGNREALTAAVDMAEECRNQTDWLVPGTTAGAVGDSPRAKARCWNTLLRVWEATGDSQWLSAINHIRNIFLLSPSYSKDLMYHTPTCNLAVDYCTRYPNGNFISPFQSGDMIHAMYLDYTLFSNQPLKQRMIEIADFAKKNGFDPNTGATGDYIIFVGSTVYHHTSTQFRGTTPTTLYNYAPSSLSFIDTLDVAYRLTGDSSYLATGKKLLSAGTKRLSIDPYTQTIADATHVGQFAGTLHGSANVYFNDDLTYVGLFLRDAALADDTPPASVQNFQGN